MNENKENIKRPNFFEEAQKRHIEAMISILQYVKLEYMNRKTVQNAFRNAYVYLIKKEDYETCAKLKKIEKEYKRNLPVSIT